jgi:nucleoside-diphosphate-sugar epimerase
LLVTGANGFLGAEIVARATAGGHSVTALVRKRAGSERFDASVTLVEGDLREQGDWASRCQDIEVVVHAAAAPGGPRATQLANTVVATERLLAGLDRTSLRRFVHVSSFSVYDFHALADGALLDEHSPLETRPFERDPYTEAKLHQERLVRAWCSEHGIACTVVRPGAIVGPGKDWNFGAALTIGRLAFVVSPRGRFRMVSVRNCADAIVRAAELTTPGTETINLVDDDLPTHADFFKRCRRAAHSDLVLVPVPWRLLDGVGRAIQAINVAFLSGRLRTPELLDHRRQEARWKPLRYSNSRARSELAWQSVDRLDEVVRMATAAPPDSLQRD